MAARRTANLLVDRFDLTPPVDVQALLEGQAEFHRVDWPYEDVDAIVTGFASASGKPVVYVRATENLLRERFTMAHELGHLVLPWHLPEANCSVDEGEFELHDPTTEQQADIFASTLLVPDRWLAELMNTHADDMTRILQDLNSTEVSTAAALQALRRYLLPGWVFEAYGGRSLVATSGTQLPDNANRRTLAREAHASGEALLNGGKVHWFKLSASVTLPIKSFEDLRTDHRILVDAIAGSGASENDYARIAASANGKVGGTLREAAGRPASETYEAMLHKLAGWEHASLLKSDDFHLWLAQKAIAIESGQTKRQR